MGKQVCVSMDELKRVGVEIIRHPEEGFFGPEVFNYDLDDWERSWGTRNVLGIRLGERVLVGDSPEAFVFDCRNEDSGNYWAFEALRALGVAYTYW